MAQFKRDQNIIFLSPLTTVHISTATALKAQCFILSSDGNFLLVLVSAAQQEESALLAPKLLFIHYHFFVFIIQTKLAMFWLMIGICAHLNYLI